MQFGYNDFEQCLLEVPPNLQALMQQKCFFEQVRQRRVGEEKGKVWCAFIADLITLSIIVYILQIGAAIATVD